MTVDSSEQSTATPAVSVLMPVYNSARFLVDAVESVLAQTFSDFEFVIVDDGSEDATREILDRYRRADRRVVTLRQANGGIAAALNAGLAVCRGRYIARMDGDDVALPDRLDAQTAFLNAHAAIGAVGGWATIIDERSMPIGELKHPTEPADVDRAIRGGAYAMLHPTMMIRRQCLLDIGGYDPAFRYAEDLDLLLRLSETTRLANLPRVVLSYRRRSDIDNAARGDIYPEWDKKALVAAHRRGRRPLAAGTLARAAERLSWTALDDGDIRTAAHQAWQACQYGPLRANGLRAFGRIVFKSFRRSPDDGKAVKQ